MKIFTWTLIVLMILIGLGYGTYQYKNQRLPDDCEDYQN